MKKAILSAYFVLLPLVCFAQHSLPGRVIGQIPAANSTELYQIQVGAFRLAQNAESLSAWLRREGLRVITERSPDLTRVMITGIPSNHVIGYLAMLKLLGFDEVIIREGRPRIAIAEKWEITDTESAFSSFEFNQDFNYIAVENPVFGSQIHFGNYSMPAGDTIVMDNLGVLRVSEGRDAIALSFSPIDDPETAQVFSATRSERIPQSPQMDLFSRTWRVVSYNNNPEIIGSYLLISNAGTYFFSHNNREGNRLSQWRWPDNTTEEFEYSHNNWYSYGRARIVELTPNSLKMADPGFRMFIPGYSSAGMDDYWELVPAGDFR